MITASLCAVTLLLSLLTSTMVAADDMRMQTLHRGNSTEPVTLDPQQSEDVSSGNILRDLFEGLVTEDPAGKLIPGQAGKWTISDDGKTYTFHLRTCLAWSNGDALTAADFVFALKRAVDPETAAPMADLLSPIVNAGAIIRGEKPVDALGIELPDSHTLVIHLERPTPWFLELLTHPIAFPVYATSLIEHKDRAFNAAHIVSNGAYKLKQWVPYERAVLSRNDNYYNNEKTFFDEVVYYPVKSNNSEFNRYRAGEFDWTDTIPPNKLKLINQDLPGEAFISPYLGSYYYGFNLTRPPFKDNPELRRALALAIDRNIIAGKILGNGELPATRWLPPGLSATENLSPDMQQNIALAKQLYARAGYSKQRPLTTTLHYNTSEQNKRIAAAISAMWKKHLGVKVTLINEEWKVFLQRRKGKTETELYRASWIADYNDASSFLTLFTSGHPKNDTGYANKDYDALVKQVETTMDDEQRTTLINKAEQKLLDDQVIIPIYHYVSRHLVKPYIKGYKSNPLDHHYSRYLSKK
jgi:ABC-type oligopeptide transport system substrate-binding subunit